MMGFVLKLKAVWQASNYPSDSYIRKVGVSSHTRAAFAVATPFPGRFICTTPLTDCPSVCLLLESCVGRCPLQVPRNDIVKFTTAQLLCLIGLYFVKSTSIGRYPAFVPDDFIV